MQLAELAKTGYEAWERAEPWAVAIDTETEGLAYYDRPFCVTLAWEQLDETEGHYFELHQFDSAPLVQEILASTPTWIFHNAKFDLQKLLLAGLIDRRDIHADCIHDTEALAHLANEHRPKGLKALAVSVLGEEDVVEVEIKSGPNKGQMKSVPREKYELDAARRKQGVTKDDGFDVLPREVIIPYAIQDAVTTHNLFTHLLPDVERFSDLHALYRHELEVTLTLLDMEARGMAVDLDYATATAKEYGKAAVKAELEIRLLTGNDDFNPNSPKQILEAFAKRGVALEATDRDTLESVDDPLAKAIVELRSLHKMHGTYLVPLLNEQRNGIIHPHFRQHGTRTGRMSSGGAEA